MLAVLEKVEGGYIASFHRPLNHSIEKVWSALTENGKLEKWMSNLEVQDLRKGGTIQFNMNDGSNSSFGMKIRDFKEKEVLEYEWGEGWVRFELKPTPEGCLLVLKEFIPSLSDHTSKDLAGWHVCLDIFKELLQGNEMAFPKGQWEKCHDKYQEKVGQMKRSNN